MKNSKFSEHQIIKALKENEQGRLVGDISRELGIRLEDDIVIGENQNVNLMANIPIEIEDIEDLMNR